MTQKSLHWDGASIGDADTLTVNAADGIGWRLGNTDYESPFVDLALRMILNGTGNRGVLKNWANELAVAGVATPVTVATGGAIVYGMPYENTAVVNVAVPTPTNDTRYDYIVLRRDWTAQTVRVTRIAGVEGGGIPALTQSPAPSGTGIYDVPLATLSIDIAGAITVTDAREFCLFGTVPGPDSIGTTQINNDAVDWADRETRTCRYFLAGGDFRPATAAGQFTPSSGTTVTWTGAPTWNGGATTQGWQLTGSAYEAVYASFSLPPNYASGDITTYVWWVDNSGAASTFYMRSNCVMFNSESTWLWYHVGTQESTYINETLVANDWYKTEGVTIESTVNSQALTYWPDITLFYVINWYNSAGAEDINILGAELIYTGYV